MIGTTLDKYEVLQKIGEGGMATVYRGRHATLERDVAIKVLHPHLSSSARNRKRFAREARAIEHLHHDNILRIFDYSGIEADDCYIITEYVSGRTLNELMQEHGRLPSELVSMIAISLCDALCYAHNEGILHRDLKPDNVMIRYDGLVKLMDFGIARFLDESQVTMTGALVGSPAFMSPEQAREEDLDIRSDLFSLGTALFYLVTGHLPFGGSNPSIILKNVIDGNRQSVVELAPDISPTLADVVERLLATHPNDRYNTAAEAREVLDASLAEAGLQGANTFSIRRFLEQPSEWTVELTEHLRTALVENGRAHLTQGDHLSALRQFNRLLSMDEDNEEVLNLVQGLHGDAAMMPAQEEGRSVRVGPFLGIAIALLLGAIATWWFLARPDIVDDDRPPVAVEQPATPPKLTQPPAPTAVAVVNDPEPILAEPAPAQPKPKAEPVLPVVAPRPEKQVGQVPSKPLPSPKVEPEPGVIPTTPPPDEQKTGMLRVRSGAIFAAVYLNGEKLGSTRSSKPFEVPVGTWDLEIRAPFVHPVTRRVTISPGERHNLEVKLRPKAARVRFDKRWAPACMVTDNGQSKGTLEELGRALRIDVPTIPHRVELDCDGKVFTHEWKTVPPEVTFPR